MRVRSRSLIYEAIQFTKEVEDASMPLPKGVYRDRILRKGFDPDNDPEYCFLDIITLQIRLKVGNWIIYEDGKPIQVLTDEKYWKYYALADEIDEEKVVEALAVDFYMIAHRDLLWDDAEPEIQNRYKEAASLATERTSRLVLNQIDMYDPTRYGKIPSFEVLAAAVEDFLGNLDKNDSAFYGTMRTGQLLLRLSEAFEPLKKEFTDHALQFQPIPPSEKKS